MKVRKKITAWAMVAALCIGNITLPDFAGRSMAADADMVALDQIQITADDYQSGNEPGKAIDGNANTIWHSSWSNRKELPLSITLSFQEAIEDIAQIRYLPRQDKDKNGIITKYTISVSEDGEHFTQIAEGHWAEDKSEKTATFDAQKKIRAVRLTAVETAGNTEKDNSLYVSAAEIRLFRKTGFTRETAKLKELLEKGEAIAAESPDSVSSDLKEALDKGKQLLDGGYAVQEEIQSATEDLENMIGEKTSFSGTDGKRMYTVDGKRIEAHGGQITKWGDTYYWYGEDRSAGYYAVGVHLYTSKNLYDWEDQGLVFRNMHSSSQFTENEYFRELYGNLSEEEQQEVFRNLQYGTAIIERPKVLYNEKTKKYVMWFHADGPAGQTGGSYARALAGVAVSDTPNGPFRFIKASRLHCSDDYNGKEKGMARDMNVFQDEDGSAYILYASEENATLYISRLSDDYLSLAVTEDAVEGVDYSRNFVNTSREAPAMFKYQGKYYLMTSGCTGWAPNEARYYEADTPLGPWKTMGNPCVGAEQDTTFRTQSTCIFAVDAAKGKFVYLGDRWNSNNLSDSRYVLLPVEFGYQYHMTIPERKEWSIQNISWKSGFELKAEDIPESEQIIGQEKDLDAFQNRKITLKNGDGSEQQAEVTWSAVKTRDSDAVALGRLEADISLEDGSTVKESIPAAWYQKKTVYFVDCQNLDSEYVKGFEKCGIHLKNKVSDQKFDGSWGLVNDPGEYRNSGLFEGGYWARSGESIVYRFTLPAGVYRTYAGVCEWWQETRYAKLNVRLVNHSGEEETKQPLASADMKTKNGDKNSIFSAEFELKEDAVIEISADKISGGDPVLSWLSIVREKDEQQTETQETETESQKQTETQETETESQKQTETRETETESQKQTETQETETESQKQTETRKQEQKESETTQKPDNNTTTAVKTGSIVKGDKKYDSYTYKILSENTVEIHALTKKGKKARNLKTFDAVKINGKTYKVTGIAKGAFKNQKNMRTLTIGKNVSRIEKEAFKGCKNLNKVLIRSKNLKKVGKNAFQGVKKTVYVKASKAKRNSYRKMLKKAGMKVKK